jgi:hypothetical protein
LPDLYDWVGVATATDDVIADDARPSPAELGVVRWVNVYRSGDYVGRALWRLDRAARVWQCRAPADPDAWPVDAEPDAVASSKDGTRREFCIGPGAHTHYWDGTGALVAAELDRLLLARTIHE